MLHHAPRAILPPGGQEPGVIGPTFLFFDGKKLSQGGHQSGTVIFFGSVLGKTSTTDGTWMINIFFVEQISDSLHSVLDPNHQVGYMRLPITAPSNKP